MIDRRVHTPRLLWVKNGPAALEMGRRYYPRKQTSVSYAADCEGIRCYGGGPSRPTKDWIVTIVDAPLRGATHHLSPHQFEPCRRQPRRIAPRQKSKGLLELSNPSKRRSTDHETVVPSFWEYPSRTVTLRSERMCHQKP